MKQIKNIAYLSFFLFIPITCIDIFDENEIKNTPKDTKQISLPFNLEISLDIIGLELKHYKDQLKQNWDTNVHTQVIIEEAEILVQTAPLQFQDELKTKIVGLFSKNNLEIEFTTQNTIIPQTDSAKKTSLDVDEDTENDLTKIKRLKLPKKHKKKIHEAKQIVAPKKIHGARRTMKRLKKEAEERQKREYEAIKAQIEAKKEAALKTRREALLEEEARMRENIIREEAQEKELSL